ncbi:MAG: hypothetical protein KJO46_09910 [Gammaproteobacteria bacterium]|nr:hypothetical protein [Gammaproteobacteria bacterium]
MNQVPDTTPAPNERLVLIRDIAVLQAKLIVDGLRDLVLVPASIVAGILSLLSTENGKPGSHFYRLLGAGKQSERWIDLFGALRNAPADIEDVASFPDASMDDLVGRLESYVVEEHKRGGITSQAKEHFDRALDAINRRGQKADP